MLLAPETSMQQDLVVACLQPLLLLLNDMWNIGLRICCHLKTERYWAAQHASQVLKPGNCLIMFDVSGESSGYGAC